MQLLSGILLAALVGFVVCNDFACYRDSMTQCQADYYKDYKNISFCKMLVAASKCQVQAAETCNLALVKEARIADLWTQVYCTEGTNFNNALINDENCDINTIGDDKQECSQGFTKELSKIREDPTGTKTLGVLCRFLEPIRECNWERFKKCSVESRQALNTVSETTVHLYKKICQLLPSV